MQSPLSSLESHGSCALRKGSQRLGDFFQCHAELQSYGRSQKNVLCVMCPKQWSLDKYPSPALLDNAKGNFFLFRLYVLRRYHSSRSAQYFLFCRFLIQLLCMSVCPVEYGNSVCRQRRHQLFAALCGQKVFHGTECSQVLLIRSQKHCYLRLGYARQQLDASF